MGWGVLAALPAAAQGVDPGEQAYVSRCARCHGTDGNGGESGPSHHRAPSAALGRGSRAAAPRGAPGGRHAGQREPRGERSVCARALPAHAQAAERPGPGADPGAARGRVLGRGAGHEPRPVRPAGARRRPPDPPPAHARRSLPHRHLAVRLADLQRHDARQPAQPARRRSTRRTSRAWCRSGSSTFPTSRACRARRWWSTA